MRKTTYLRYRRRLDVAKRTLVVILMSLMTIGYADLVFTKVLHSLFKMLSFIIS